MLTRKGYYSKFKIQNSKRISTTVKGVGDDDKKDQP
jgi:hypothetical protein